MNRNIAKRKNMPLVGIAAASLVGMASLGLAPGLSQIAAAYPDISETTIALLITLPTIMTMIVTFFAAPIGKIASKKKLILFGILLVIIGGLLPYFISEFSFVLVCRSILGIGIGISIPIITALPMDYYPEGELRNRAIGIQAAFSGGSAIIFTMLGGVLAGNDWKHIYLVYLVPVLLFLVVLFTLPERGNADGQESREIKIIFDRGGLVYALLIFIYMCMFNTLSLNASYLVNTVGGSSVEAGYVTSSFSLLAFLGGLIFAAVAKIFCRFTMAFGLFLSGAGLVIMGIGQNVWVMIFGAAICGLGMCTVMPTCVSKISEKTSPQALTFTISMYMAGGYLGQSCTPYVVPAMSRLGGQTIPSYYIVPGLGLIIFGVLNGFANIKRT